MYSLEPNFTIKMYIRNAPNLFKSREQYRGVSFATGAAETWRTVTTIPNLLRVFNPELVGGSVNIGGEKGSNLNLARFVEKRYSS